MQCGQIGDKLVVSVLILMPFVPNLSTPYLESALELCFGDVDDDVRGRQDLLLQYSGVYAEIGRSLYAEWLEILHRADSVEAHELLAYALHNRQPFSPPAALSWLQVQFEESMPLWQLLGCHPT
jgi:hypothetical protein